MENKIKGKNLQRIGGAAGIYFAVIYIVMILFFVVIIDYPKHNRAKRQNRDVYRQYIGHVFDLLRLICDVRLTTGSIFTGYLR